MPNLRSRRFGRRKRQQGGMLAPGCFWRLESGFKRRLLFGPMAGFFNLPAQDLGFTWLNLSRNTFSRPWNRVECWQISSRPGQQRCSGGLLFACRNLTRRRPPQRQRRLCLPVRNGPGRLICKLRGVLPRQCGVGWNFMGRLSRQVMEVKAGERPGGRRRLALRRDAGGRRIWLNLRRA